MKLTKKQEIELRNCHNGVGFVAYKVNDSTIATFEFFTDKNGDQRFKTNSLNPPKISFNQDFLNWWIDRHGEVLHEEINGIKFSTNGLCPNCPQVDLEEREGRP